MFTLSGALITNPHWILKDKYPYFEVGLKCIIVVF